MITDSLYEERLSSRITESLFITLSVICLGLYIWMLAASNSAFLRTLFIVLFFFFLFCSVNYRVLTIRITTQSLRLKFGIFSWTVALANIQECQHDDPPLLMKYGGAGIHFMLVRGRYRASFNFLEHARVVIALKKKAGPVADISFSTRHPDEVIHSIQQAMQVAYAE